MQKFMRNILFACSFSIFNLAEAKTSLTEHPPELGFELMMINAYAVNNYDNIWQRLQSNFRLETVQADLVAYYENQYLKHPKGLQNIINRSLPFMHFILEEIDKRNLPSELALIPIIESNFDPLTISTVGATGLWHFMPITASDYSLENTFWYDGRRDIMNSTYAALDYFQLLYNKIGNWPLALAAYNWGIGRVTKAASKMQSQGLQEHFETMNMPEQTRHYVPKLLAIRNILTQPEKFGIVLPSIDNQPYFAKVEVSKHMDIDLIASLAEISEAEFRKLNPAYHLPVYAYKPGRSLILPVDKISIFQTNLASLSPQIPTMRFAVHQVTDGDSLELIAERYEMSIADLIKINRMTKRNLKLGQPILVAARKSMDVGLQTSKNSNNDS